MKVYILVVFSNSIYFLIFFCFQLISNDMINFLSMCLFQAIVKNFLERNASVPLIFCGFSDTVEA